MARPSKSSRLTPKGTRSTAVDAAKQYPIMPASTSPHPSGMSRDDRRKYAEMEKQAARLDGRASRHVAALQQTRTYWCEEGGDHCPGGVTHVEVYCPTCSHREGRPVYELRGQDAAAHPEWKK